jgi:hypothetical protein
MKPSTRRLLGMLPRTLVMRLDVVAGEVIGVDLVDGQGKATGLDPNYPGFGECLARLVTAGHVLHIADLQSGTPSKGRLERVFFTIRPDTNTTKGTDPS